MWDTLRKEERLVQREEINWEPRSEVMVWGTPKREIQVEQSASAQARAEEEERGAASTQRVVRSMMVKMWV
jgi:hypothetical protein